MIDFDRGKIPHISVSFLGPGRDGRRQYGGGDEDLGDIPLSVSVLL